MLSSITIPKSDIEVFCQRWQIIEFALLSVNGV